TSKIKSEQVVFNIQRNFYPNNPWHKDNCSNIPNLYTQQIYDKHKKQQNPKEKTPLQPHQKTQKKPQLKTPNPNTNPKKKKHHNNPPPT
ncbi:hypothetical protein NQU36_26535, partial [Escherichia coli]|uniref:hypothetical protein n=1 Tax=Escherichia coli TaxID=562 RepID=UPI002118CFF2